MIGYTYTITNKLGDSFKINDHITDPNNFIALQQYPEMDIDVKNSEIDLQGQHGIWDFFSYFGKRAITFAGIIIGDDEEAVENIKSQIVRVLSLPLQPEEDNDGYVTVSWIDATGAEWSFDAKINRSPKFTRNMKEIYKLDFIFSLKTNNPFILSSDPITGNGTRGYYLYGVTLPTLIPFTIGLSSVNGLTVINDGTMQAHTLIRYYGEADGVVTNPTIHNNETGKVFKMNLTLADDTEYIEIDSKEGTVIDQTGADRSADIDDASEFILLKAGTNTIMYTADENSRTPAGAFSVVFNSTKI